MNVPCTLTTCNYIIELYAWVGIGQSEQFWDSNVWVEDIRALLSNWPPSVTDSCACEQRNVLNFGWSGRWQLLLSWPGQNSRGGMCQSVRVMCWTIVPDQDLHLEVTNQNDLTFELMWIWLLDLSSMMHWCYWRAGSNFARSQKAWNVGF